MAIFPEALPNPLSPLHRSPTPPLFDLRSESRGVPRTAEIAGNLAATALQREHMRASADDSMSPMPRSMPGSAKRAEPQRALCRELFPPMDDVMDIDFSFVEQGDVEDFFVDEDDDDGEEARDAGGSVVVIVKAPGYKEGLVQENGADDDDDAVLEISAQEFRGEGRQVRSLFASPRV